MNIYQFTARDIEGRDRRLSDYAGKLMLIVNTASACGLTPQYSGLEKLHQTFKGDLVVLGFPCNQFGGQEPGTEKDIALFCETSFAVTFPLFSKVEVNGASADPLFAYLKAETPGEEQGNEIAWNFAKFLIGRDGKPIARFSPRTAPEEIEADIAKALTA